MLDSWSITAAIVAVLVIAYYQLIWKYKYFERIGIPYYSSMPLLGSFWEAVIQRDNFADISRKIYNSYPDVKYLGMYDTTTPVLMIRDTELIKAISVKHFEQFPDHRSFQNEATDPLFAKNLFALRGDRWREIRNLLSPAFTSSKMKSMFILMRDCAKEYGDYFASLTGDESTIELKDAFTRYTNDVIATCAFGVEVNSMKDRKNKFYVYGREGTTFGSWASIKFFITRVLPVSVCTLLRVRLIRKEISDFFIDLVSETIKTREEKGIVRPDMIQLMMESKGKLGSGREMSMMDICAQAFVFFFGGFESTSTLMCFAAYEIAVNDDIQRRLQNEIDQVLEDRDGEVTYGAINEMKFLDAIIYEALRMYPVVVATDRICTKPFELPPNRPGEKPHLLKEGDNVWFPIYGIQRDPQFYPEPDKFDPDRFLNDTKQMINSGLFLTFGMGPRMCIGNRFAMLETKVLLFHLFARCNLVPCSKTTIPMKLNKKGFAMTAENGFWFKIEPRTAKKDGAEKIAVPGTTMLIDKIPDRYPDN